MKTLLPKLYSCSKIADQYEINMILQLTRSVISDKGITRPTAYFTNHADGDMILLRMWLNTGSFHNSQWAGVEWGGKLPRTFTFVNPRISDWLGTVPSNWNDLVNVVELEVRGTTDET